MDMGYFPYLWAMGTACTIESTMIHDILSKLTVHNQRPKNYRKTSSISRTKFKNLNVFCPLLKWYLPNPLNPGVKLRMKM